MPSKLQLQLSAIFMKIFMRDRQSVFFSLFFPVIFMVVFGFLSNVRQEPINLGIAASANTETASDFIRQISDHPLFDVTVSDEESLRSELIAGEQALVLVLPPQFAAANHTTELPLIVDASQFRQLELFLPVLEQALLAIERHARNAPPMFTLLVTDVQARSQRYLDFLLPGLLAFTLMQLGVAGSGFNIVEYRRKGILKRLFVTPIKPADFVIAIVLARLAIVLVQLSLLLLLAVLVFDVSILGNYAWFYVVMVLGALVFLCLGFSLGSLAKTQQSVMAMGNIFIFPQVFLAGIFYPIASLPAFVQPLAKLLPLSFVVAALRDIANEGATLLQVAPSLLGMVIWLGIAFLLAARLFVWKQVAN